MSSESSSSSLSTFLTAHKRTLLICTAAAVLAAGSLYWLASASPSAPPAPKKRKDKKDSKKKQRRDEGPIIEEIGGGDPAALAASLKAQGNDAYKAHDYKTAVDLYTKAIEVSPKDEAVFYSNRAACYINLSPPNYDLAIADCTKALSLNPQYIKALNRRASAYESTGEYQLALNDFTASTFIQKFADPSASASIERVLKKLAEAKAEDVIKARENDIKLPSYTFISAYFAAFRPRAHPETPENSTQGDETLALAFGALDAGDYAHCLSLVNESIEQGISTDRGKAEALNLRGTFKFLLGQVEESKQDFLSSIALCPSFTQTHVKIASVYMEQSLPNQAFTSFDTAIEQNPADPDIYYHRGQVLFITSNFAEASENYAKSTELDSGFIFSHIQRAVAEYKAGNVAKSMALFRRILDDSRFRERSEGFNYFGELLLDQSRYPEAIEMFDRAIEIEKKKKGEVPNVLALVNKALAMYQWKQDITSAEEYCNEALELDPTCDAAIASLAQFNLQQASINPGPSGLERIQKAIGYLDKQVELARTKEEIVAVLQYRYASESQLEFQKNYPEVVMELGGMARAL